MSKYTTEVRFICEASCGYDMSQGYGKVSDILAESWDKVFDFDFPIFDEEYRSVLCQKILKHYYTREIGFETVGLWKLKLDTAMNEIMPYYNKMYQSANLDYNPLYDADYRRIHEGSDESNTDTKTDGSVDSTRITEDGGEGYQLYSDTPQGALYGVQDENYLTNATKNTRDFRSTDDYNGKNKTDTTTNYSSTDEYVDHIVGKFPGRSYASLIKEYREALINVDMMVIDALRDLFLKIW